MRKRLTCTVGPEQSNQRLDAVVGRWLARALGPALSKSVVRKVIMAGAVQLNGRPVRRPGLTLQAGSRLEARIDAGEIERTRSRRRGAASVASEFEASHRARTRGIDEMDALAILYEDDDLIAVAKPAGMVIHATADPARPDVFNAVRRLLAGGHHDDTRSDRADKAPLVYLGLHHRLDVDTSGVVLFTKQERANARLAEQFAHGEVTKVYHALVRRPIGRVRSEWRIENELAPSGTDRRARMVAAATGGVRAATSFRVVQGAESRRGARQTGAGWKERQGVLLIEARPETGRKHQIRAHLAQSGMPILGDTRYGGLVRAAGCAAPRVMLHASRLSFRHPVSGNKVTIDCPYPPDFAQMLRCLRKYK